VDPPRLHWSRLTLLLLVVGGCRPTAPHPLPEDLPWLPLRRVSVRVGEIALPHAAVLVGWRFPGRDSLDQQHLDFGALDTGLFGIPIKRMLPDSSDAAVYRGRIAALGNRDDSTNALPRSLRPDIGTLGVARLETRIAILDFPGGRAAVLPPGQPLPPGVEARTAFVPLRYVAGRVFIELRIGGEGLNTFVDIGSGLAPLLLTPERWARLTGRDGRGSTIELPADGRPLRLERAPLPGPLALGGERLRPAHASTVRSGPEGSDIARWPGSPEAVAGPELFADRVIVVDIRGRRFGLLRR